MKPISYMMINPKLPVSLQSSVGKIVSLPKGLSFTFTVSYHDNLGRTFDSTNALPKVRPNRFDIAQIHSGTENNTFNVQVVQEGRVGVKVYDSNNPLLKDFLVISVDDAIHPKLVKYSFVIF